MMMEINAYECRFCDSDPALFMGVWQTNEVGKANHTPRKRERKEINSKCQTLCWWKALILAYFETSFFLGFFFLFINKQYFTNEGKRFHHCKYCFVIIIFGFNNIFPLRIKLGGKYIFGP